MALVKKQISSTRVILLIVFLVVAVGATILVLTGGFSFGGGGSILTNISTGPRVTPIVTDVGADLFQDPRYLELRTLEVPPVTAQPVGNDDPFLKTP